MVAVLGSPDIMHAAGVIFVHRKMLKDKLQAGKSYSKYDAWKAAKLVETLHQYGTLLEPI